MTESLLKQEVENSAASRGVGGEETESAQRGGVKGWRENPGTMVHIRE